MAHWILKSEPHVYSFADLQREKRTEWTGIRNFEARNFLRTALPGDVGLLYHSGDDKALVGIVKVTRGPKTDPTATEGDWVSVEVSAVKPLPRAVTLSELKAHARLQQLKLVTRSRLSVTPCSAQEFALVEQVASQPPAKASAKPQVRTKTKVSAQPKKSGKRASKR
jgi:predicted RNA-binding protein with PUA-like domain